MAATREVNAVLLASYPKEAPTADNFKLVKVPVRSILETGQVRFKVLYLSVDPYMRGRMKEGGWKLAEVPVGQGMIEVIETANEKYKVGSVYMTTVPWQEETILSPDTLSPPALELPKPDPNLLSLLGIAGLTAHIGVLTVGQIKEGETLVVSGAAGSVGVLVGQIGKLKNVTLSVFVVPTKKFNSSNPSDLIT